MTWVAVGVGVAGAVSGAYSSQKSAKAQSSAAKKQMAMANQANAMNEPWMQRGGQAAEELQILMGLGNNDTYESLYEQFAPEFTTTVKKKGKTGKLGKIGKMSTGGSGLSLSEKIFTKGGKTLSSLDKAGLEAKIQETLARQKANRESGKFGSLRKTFTNEDFVKDPGYNWRLEEGNRGVQGSMAAKGGLFSGAAGKALSRFNQGFASNEFGSAEQRYRQNQADLFNRLSGIAGTGQAATGQGMQQQNYIGDIYGTMGANKAAGYMGQANALSSGLQGVGTAWQGRRAK